MSERVLIVTWLADERAGLTEVALSLAGQGGTIAELSLQSEVPAVPPAQRIFRISTSGFDPARSDHGALAIIAATRASGATIVVVGPTKLEREAIARAGAVLGAPSVTGVRSPRVAAEGLEVSRDLLSGNATAVERVLTRPALLSLSALSPGAELASDSGTSTEPEPLSLELPQYHFQRISMHPKPAGGVDLEAADRIVSVGRGLQRKEDLALIEALARQLGAVVGCTRPLAAESGWLSDDHWVGLTGHRVRPTLYLAVGISGAAQHLVGMRDSKVVVAINKDPNAPIFQQADYQVVGDLYSIVPELTRRLSAATGPS
jgi:electron transfer flavoprotein alpha subunit